MALQIRFELSTAAKEPVAIKKSFFHGRMLRAPLALLYILFGLGHMASTHALLQEYGDDVLRPRMLSCTKPETND